MIRTTPDQIAKLIQKRAAASKKVARAAALSAAHRGKAMIGNYTPGDQGQLGLSWHVQNYGRTATGAFAKQTPQIAALYNDAPHAGIVEGGARPHKVSKEGWWAIYEWVERHFTDRAEDGELDVYGNDPEVSRITWAIVKKIGRHGQKATYFVRDKLPVFFQITHAEINHQFARLAKQGNL